MELGYRGMLDNGSRLTAGMSYYDYLETQGQTPFYDGTGNGNRVDLAGNYLNDFNELELFAELNMTLPSGLSRCSPMSRAIRKAATPTRDSRSVLTTARKSAGRLARGYAYQDLEADAVIATFTDSDFAGGGTDGKGHVIELNYALRDRWTLGFRYFLNERGADAGNEHDYNRLQADVVFAY